MIIRGTAPVIETWRATLARVYAPHRLTIAIPDDAPHLPAALAAKAPRGEATAYVCHGSVCDAPVDSLAAIEPILARTTT